MKNHILLAVCFLSLAILINSCGQSSSESNQADQREVLCEDIDGMLYRVWPADQWDTFPTCSSTFVDCSGEELAAMKEGLSCLVYKQFDETGMEIPCDPDFDGISDACKTSANAHITPANEVQANCPEKTEMCNACLALLPPPSFWYNDLLRLASCLEECVCYCGDNIHSASLGEDCDPPDGNECNINCHVDHCAELPEGASCDDGNNDNINDVCVNNVCAGEWDWISEPVYIHNIARGKRLGIINDASVWPYFWRFLDKSDKRARPWTFTEYPAHPSTYYISAYPSYHSYYSNDEEYHLCADEDSGYRLEMYLSSSAGPGGSRSNDICLWKVEKMSDSRFRLKSWYFDENRAHTDIGRLMCSDDYDCSFDYNSLADDDYRIVFRAEK